MKTVVSSEVGHIAPFYAVSLPFELSDGKYVAITWKPTDKESTSFNIAEQPDFNGNILLHFNPRVSQNVIVRNSKSKTAGYGSEEKDGGMPIQLGVTCEIKLVVRADFYECFVDGAQHCTFQHRIKPVNTAKFFYASGSGEVYNVTFGDEAADKAAAECKGITTPYDKPCNVFPGSKIYVSGIPSKKETRVRVILKSDEDYAFCFAARLDQDCVVMNSNIGGEWGSEIRPDAFPFRDHQFFNICITVASDKFKVCVNDQPFTEFNHRLLPLSKINGLRLDGDMTVCSLCENVH